MPMNTICKMVNGHWVTPYHHQHRVLRSSDALHLTRPIHIIIKQCLQAYGFIRILSGTKQEYTEYGKLDITYGFRRN